MSEFESTNSSPTYLSQTDVDFYNENGYLLIPNFWNQETITTLTNRINHIIDNLDLTESKGIFSPKKDDQIRDTDDYFLSSGREIRYFWEEKAWKDGNLINDPKISINKIGHGLHDLDNEFEKVSYDKKLGQICRDLGQKTPLAVQSMYIFKQAKIGGKFNENKELNE